MPKTEAGDRLCIYSEVVVSHVLTPAEAKEILGKIKTKVDSSQAANAEKSYQMLICIGDEYTDGDKRVVMCEIKGDERCAGCQSMVESTRTRVRADCIVITELEEGKPMPKKGDVITPMTHCFRCAFLGISCTYSTNTSLGKRGAPRVNRKLFVPVEKEYLTMVDELCTIYDGVEKETLTDKSELLGRLSNVLNQSTNHLAWLTGARTRSLKGEKLKEEQLPTPNTATKATLAIAKALTQSYERSNKRPRGM